MNPHAGYPAWSARPRRVLASMQCAREQGCERHLDRRGTNAGDPLTRIADAPLSLQRGLARRPVPMASQVARIPVKGDRRCGNEAPGCTAPATWIECRFCRHFDTPHEEGGSVPPASVRLPRASDRSISHLATSRNRA